MSYNPDLLTNRRGGAEFELSREDYDLTVAAVGHLAGSGSLEIPSFLDLTSRLKAKPGLQAYLASQASQGVSPELVANIPLPEDRTNQYFLDMVARFDKIESDGWGESQVCELLWPIAFLKPGQGVAAKFGLLLNDMVDPLDYHKPANSFGEPGLVYTGMVPAAQKQALGQERALRAKQGVVIKPEHPTEHLVMLTKLRLNNMSPPDYRYGTVTAFVGGNPITAEVDGDSHDYCLTILNPATPYMTQLRGTGVNSAWDDTGIRRKVRL